MTKNKNRTNNCGRKVTVEVPSLVDKYRFWLIFRRFRLKKLTISLNLDQQGNIRALYHEMTSCENWDGMGWVKISIKYPKRHVLVQNFYMGSFLSSGSSSRISL